MQSVNPRQAELDQRHSRRLQQADPVGGSGRRASAGRIEQVGLSSCDSGCGIQQVRFSRGDSAGAIQQVRSSRGDSAGAIKQGRSSRRDLASEHWHAGFGRIENGLKEKRGERANTRYLLVSPRCRLHPASAGTSLANRPLPGAGVSSTVICLSRHTIGGGCARSWPRFCDLLRDHGNEYSAKYLLM